MDIEGEKKNPDHESIWFYRIFKSVLIAVEFSKEIDNGSAFRYKNAETGIILEG